MHKLNLWGITVTVMHKQQLKVPQIAMLVKYVLLTLLSGLALTTHYRCGSEQFDHALSGLADSNPLHWNENNKINTWCDWQFWQSCRQLGGCFSTEVKCLFTNLALVGSPRWSECNFAPVTAGPRSSELPRCCSTSRETSRTQRTPASKRPCWLQESRCVQVTHASQR